MKSIIILCGGRSTRMGKDKGSLLFKGKPMILHVYDEVKEIADEIIIVLRDPEQVNEYIKLLKTERNTVIVTDESKDQGPLVGIFSGLSNIKSDKAQVLPCDSPYISKKFILKMFKFIEGSDFDAVVPIWNDGHIEPLHSIYKKDSLNTMEKLINHGIRDVNSLVNSLNVKFIDAKQLDPQSFTNVNTIKDLSKNI
ncbi:MAG: molybdenum cofactor guanylyltransferase [Methanobacterium sp.]